MNRKSHNNAPYSIRPHHQIDINNFNSVIEKLSEYDDNFSDDNDNISN